MLDAGWAIRQSPEFFKGRNAHEEMTEARKDWKFTVERIESVTDPTGVILHLTEVRRGN